MKYNINNLIEALLAKLTARQKDILSSRYGLTNGQPATLAKIGNEYGVTRERIRQIEALSLRIIRDKLARKDFNNIITLLKKHFNKLGGVHRESLLCQELRRVVGGDNSQSYNNKINFLLKSCGIFYYYPEDSDFYAFWHTGKKDMDKAVSLINKLANFLKDKREELITGGKFNQFFNQFVKAQKWQRSSVLNYISISKKFAANAFNDFGLSYWPEISPKTSRDWAYLVLKKQGQPLHFTVLTQVVNKLRKNKRTNPQTVHNELIKDGRFVLVGRGTYGLKEFNLMAGTAREVIVKILEKHGAQDAKSLIKLVLNERAFKENTLLLNLQDRRYFTRLEDGKYIVKQA